MPAKAKTFGKNILRILAYCGWFGFTLWLSFWFFRLVVSIEDRFGIFGFRTRFRINLISGFGFLCLVCWLPIWWLRRRRAEMARFTGRCATFLMILLGCTILCTIFWDKFIADKLYNCTDAIGFDFLHPGDWVHGNYAAVPQIVTGRSMSEPDTIKAGWSVFKLWCLWWSLVAVSVAVSGSAACLIWRRKTRRTVIISAATCGGSAGS